MSKDLNKVQVIGRLGADPDVKYTAQGTAVTTFRVASSRSYKTSDGNQTEETEWFRVVTWNRLAEICGEYLSKGSRVYIEGRLKTRSWQDDSGETRYMTEVVADDMIMLDARQAEQEPEPEPARPAQRQTTTDPASDRQRRALENIAGERGYSLAQEVRKRFNGRELDALSADEASQLLSEWQRAGAQRQAAPAQRQAQRPARAQPWAIRQSDPIDVNPLDEEDLPF